MPLTFTGRNVTAWAGTPSIIDIAVGLSRQPRFAGQTRRWWSVLDHTLFCDMLVVADGGGPMLRKAVLLHDAHEALTADVPTPFKYEMFEDLQHNLDVRIMGIFYPGGWPAYYAYHQRVKGVDKRALRAEACWVGPPSSREHLDAWGITDDNVALVDADVGILRLGLNQGLLGIPPVTWPVEPDQHPGVQAYLQRMLTLL